MKKLFFIFLFCFSFSAIAEVSYVPGIADLPVPEKFELKENSSNIFDVREGKIVDAVFTGDGSRDGVIEFYAQTLPELGWDVLSNTRFERNREILEIIIVEDIFSDEMEVTYSLRPSAE